MDSNMIRPDDTEPMEYDAWASTRARTVENADHAFMTSLRKIQQENHWLQRRASRFLGLSYRKLLKLDRFLDRKQSANLVKIAMESELTNELRYAIAYRIRRGNAKYEDGLAIALGKAAGIEKTNAIHVFTTTSEDMFHSEYDEITWTGQLEGNLDDYVNAEFTGNIDVIIDMESDANGELVASRLQHDNDNVPSSDPYEYCQFDYKDVEAMLDVLEHTGACQVFNVVDGYTASYRWNGVKWVIHPYQYIFSEQEQQASIMVMHDESPAPTME